MHVCSAYLHSFALCDRFPHATVLNSPVLLLKHHRHLIQELGCWRVKRCRGFSFHAKYGINSHNIWLGKNKKTTYILLLIAYAELYVLPLREWLVVVSEIRALFLTFSLEFRPWSHSGSAYWMKVSVRFFSGQSELLVHPLCIHARFVYVALLNAINFS